MPLTAAQTTTFFEDMNGLAISAETCAQLQEEGIEIVTDLMEFDAASIKEMVSNFRRAQLPITFGANCQKQLIEIIDLIYFYSTIVQDLMSNINAYPTIKNFAEQWTALKDRKDDDQPTVLKITKEVGILQWMESFNDFLHQVIEAC